MASNSQKVLVAEDDPILALVIRMQLNSLGYAVEIAQNGADAVEIYQKEPVKLVLMDIAMPVLDGLEATARIREIEKSTKNRATIVAVTGQSSKAECIEAGMDDFIQKPVALERLRLLAESYLKH